MITAYWTVAISLSVGIVTVRGRLYALSSSVSESDDSSSTKDEEEGGGTISVGTVE